MVEDEAIGENTPPPATTNLGRPRPMVMILLRSSLAMPPSLFSNSRLLYCIIPSLVTLWDPLSNKKGRPEDEGATGDLGSDFWAFTHWPLPIWVGNESKENGCVNDRQTDLTAAQGLLGPFKLPLISELPLAD